MTDLLFSVQDIENLCHMIGYNSDHINNRKFRAWRNQYYCSHETADFERLCRLRICKRFQTGIGTEIEYRLTKYGAEILSRVLGVKIIFD